MANLKIYINCDTQDYPRDTSGVDWVEMSLANDYLIYSNGSTVVADGEPIPTIDDLNQAGTVIGSIDVTVSKYFLADVSENTLKEIYNAGNQNKRYVFCFSFDGATASEPLLELWDNSDLDSVDLYSLGSGDPGDSWWRGVVTTDGLPGSDWSGSRLAGSSITHYLALNNGNGALTAAKDLYANLKIIIPANFDNAGAEQPIFVVKHTSN